MKAGLYDVAYNVVSSTSSEYDKIIKGYGDYQEIMFNIRDKTAIVKGKSIRIQVNSDG